MLFNDVKFIPRNFEAISQLQAELYLVKVGKLDACIRPIFLYDSRASDWLDNTLIYKNK